MALALSSVTIQSTDKPSMKFSKRIWVLIFAFIQHWVKIYSIYSIEEEVIQQAALWPKLGREAETAKVESTDLCPEGQAVIVTASGTAGGQVLGVVSCPLGKNQKVQYLIISSYVFEYLCHRAYLWLNISCLHLSPKGKKNISLNVFSFPELSLQWCYRSSLL